MNRIIITQTGYIIGEKQHSLELCIDLNNNNYLKYLTPSYHGVFPYKREEFETQMNSYKGEKISFEDAIYGITEALSREFNDKKEIEVIFADTCDEETMKLYVFSFNKIFEHVKTFMMSDLFELITFYYWYPTSLNLNLLKKGMNEVKYLFVDGFDSVIITCDISERKETTFTSDIYKDFGEKIEFKFDVPQIKLKSVERKSFGLIKMYRELEFETDEKMIYKFPLSFAKYRDSMGVFETPNHRMFIFTPQEGNVYFERRDVEEYVRENFDGKEAYVYLGELAGRRYIPSLFGSNGTYYPFTSLNYVYEYGMNNKSKLFICHKHYNEKGKILRLFTKTYGRGGYINEKFAGKDEYWEVDDSEDPEYFADEEHKYPIKKYSHSYVEGKYLYNVYFNKREDYFIPRIEAGIDDVYNLKESKIEMIEFEPKYTLSMNDKKEKSWHESQIIRTKFFKRMSSETGKKFPQLRKEYPEITKTNDSDEIKLKIKEIFPDFEF